MAITISFSFEISKKDGKIYSEYPYCYVSGNKLQKSYKTNYIVTLKSGYIMSFASIRYLATIYDDIEKKIQRIETIDTKNSNLIDAQSAYYVVNSKAKESYSKFSKFAFASKSDAQEFAKEYSGDIRDFGFTLYLANRDLSIDSEYTKPMEKRDFFRGKNIKDRVCENIDIKNKYIYEYMKYIKESKVCGRLSDKNLKALSYYLVNSTKFEKDIIVPIDVPKEAKCPVCGMYVAKYPKWVALIEGEHKHYFDGNKDFFKFLLNPKKFGHECRMDNLYVTDYYTLKKIDAKSAYYVYGSNVLGPMGNELISFEDEKSAKIFAREHLGKKIYKYNQIDEKLIYTLD
jgi:nitrous oxide reductase accessory protein NosL